jgi:hypothetical protein
MKIKENDGINGLNKTITSKIHPHTVAASFGKE